MAAICAGVGSEPVKVRNLSSNGALVEGAVLPQIGTQVRLCRADLEVAGEIVWCRDGRAGLRFESSVSVEDWLPHGSAKAGQHHVDSLVQEFKTSGAARSQSSVTLDQPERKDISTTELNDLREAIESLAEDLAGEAAVVERHWSKLQTLDVVAQALARIAAARLT